MHVVAISQVSFCEQVNPDRRVTVERLLAHPWVMEGYKEHIDWESKFDVSIKQLSLLVLVYSVPHEEREK